MKKEKIYEKLRWQIINADLLPNEIITEHALAQKYNISRTPIREILSRLQNDKLIKIVSKQGNFVSGISSERCESIVCILTNVEPQIFTTALKHKKRVIKHLEKNIELQKDSTKDINKFNKHVLDFHKIFYHAADKHSLYKIVYYENHELNRLKFLLHRVNTDYIQMTIDVNEKILKSFIDEDVEKFTEILKKYLDELFENAFHSNPIVKSFLTIMETDVEEESLM